VGISVIGAGKKTAASKVDRTSCKPFYMYGTNTLHGMPNLSGIVASSAAAPAWEMIVRIEGQGYIDLATMRIGSPGAVRCIVDGEVIFQGRTSGNTSGGATSHAGFFNRSAYGIYVDSLAGVPNAVANAVGGTLDAPTGEGAGRVGQVANYSPIFPFVPASLAAGGVDVMGMTTDSVYFASEFRLEGDAFGTTSPTTAGFSYYVHLQGGYNGTLTKKSVYG
jgi:hypothetical protein